MRADIKRESRVTVASSTSLTMAAAHVVRLVRDMFLASGNYPLLGDVIDALIVAEELDPSTSRAAESPREYWENRLASQLGEGGSLRYVEDSEIW